ncbi:polymorphic toxin-type HINT domain-containing protein [Micromonospora sp. CPCC 206061]|uniref:polymorphic toxin-type HINT domain-containing protein n=1 Tax=Micromonospora sp. CPCC 206061 TaxID=3122410 RepID=UPI002FF2475B
MRHSRRFMLLCAALAVLLTATLLIAIPARPVSAAPRTPVAPAGAGPVERPLPAAALPNHGLPKGQRSPVVPPAAKAEGAARKPTAADRARTAAARAAAADPAATVARDVLLRPGFLLGDTSLVVYFNGEVVEGDPTSFAQWWATVTDVESGAEQRSVTLGQSDLSKCQVPRTLCRSFGTADGWTLDPARRYTATITVVQPDGSEAISVPSAAAQPRKTATPPSLPAAQAAGCGCPTVLGPTTSPQGIRGAQVNTATGAFIRTERDFVMPSYGIPFQATRFYSSANPTGGMFGPGWTWTYDARVVAAEGGAVRVRAEDGSEAVYTRAGDGSYTRPPGIRSKLSAVADGWRLVTPDQRTLRFNAEGQLLSVANARGHGVTLRYTSGLLTSVIDASGRVVRIENRTDLRMITKITLPDGRSTQFDYQDGRLLKVQDPRGYTHSYAYNAAGRLTQVTDARGNAHVRNTYDANGRVAEQRDPHDALTRFEWFADRQEAKTTDPDGVVVYDGYRDNVLIYSQNGNNDVVNHRYDERLHKGLVVDPKGNQEETHHDGEGNPVSRKAPEPFSFTEVNVFDPRNNLTSHRDGRGNTWSYTFNENNEMTGQANPAHDQGYQYEYDNRGLVTRRIDPRDKATTYEYDTHGNRVAEIAPTGRRTEFTYDGTGRMTSVVDPRGTVPGGNKDAFRTRVVYDQAGNVIEQWQPGKPAPFRITYDELGNQVVQTDPLSNSVRFTFDKASRLVETKSPRGDVTATTYTAGGRRASVTDGEGNKTTFTYDAAGRVATETSPRGNADPDRAAEFTTTYHYDFNGNLVRMDRPYGPGGARVQVDSAFDELDRPEVQTDQLGKTTSVEYDNAGNVVGMTNENGEKLGYTYDAANRRTDGTSPDAAPGAEIEYDQAGNPTRQVTPTGGVVTWQYDDDGRPVAVTEPRGNVAGATPDDFTTRYAYDPAGNLATVTDPLGSVTRFTYDASNRLTAKTDANGHTTRYTFDDADRLTSVVGPDAPNNQALTYTYDADGRVIKATDPLSHTTSMEYDRAGRLTVHTDPIGRRREYVYDPDGNLTQLVTARIVEGDPRVDPNRPARTIFYEYDNVDRLIRKQFGAGGQVDTFGYDAKNRLASAADPGGVQIRTYDDTDRLTTVTRGDETFRYEYDSDDNVTARIYPNGTRVDATYDAGDRVTSLTASRGGSSARYGFDYDVADQLIRTTYPASTGVVEERSYDRAARMTSVSGKRGDQVLSQFDLTLDPVGNPTRITSTRGAPGEATVVEATAYRYDAADRLTSVCFGAQSCDGAVAERTDYTYDLVGNRTTQKVVAPGQNKITTYTYDGADQLMRETTTGSVSNERTFEYDLEGNQTRAGSDRFTYRLDHTLLSATVDGQQTTYSYDATGMRVGSTTGTGDAAVRRQWSWDVNSALPLLAAESETGPRGTAERGYLYGGDGRPLALLAPNGEGLAAHSYLHDWLNGVSDVVDPTGTPEWAYEYDPFGVARGDNLTDGGRKLTDDAPANPLQYAGGYRDSSQSDRYHLRARNYDPSTGRFDASDPGPTDSTAPAISTYAYANNRPTVLTDPSGMDPDGANGMGEAYAAYYTCMADAACRAQYEADMGAATASATGGDGYVENPDYASAKKVVDEADGLISRIGDEIVNLILDLVGFNDAKKCVTEGDIVACISTALQAVPWGKMFKAAKVMIKAIGVGARLVEAYGKLRAARKALEGIPRFVKAAGKTADEAAASKKYASNVRNAVDEAKDAGGKAKQTTKKATNAKRKKTKCENSFAAGTLVVMADGSTKAIEKVQPGDTVLATDPQTGETRPEEVTAAITNTGDKELVDLTLVGAGAGGGGPPSVANTVTATDGHPFWTVERGWVDAGDVRTGEHLRDVDGSAVLVAATAHRTEHTTVHNLTVDDLHTYYVQTQSGTGALDHNSSCGEYVEYGSTDISKKAAEFRLKGKNPDGTTIKGGQTVVTVKYRVGKTATGEDIFDYKSFANTPRKQGDVHAEVHMDNWLTSKGIQPDDVAAIYSDRAVCAKCNPVLAKWGHEKVTWTHPSGTNISKAMARQALGMLT